MSDERTRCPACGWTAGHDRRCADQGDDKLEADEANRRAIAAVGLEALRAEMADAKRRADSFGGSDRADAIVDWMRAVEAQLVLIFKTLEERR